MFSNKNDVTFDYIIDGRHTGLRNSVIGVADERLDCVAFVGTPATILFDTNGDKYVPKVDTDCVTNAIIADRVAFSATSWACYYMNWKEIYTKYLDRNIWIPLTGDVAGNKCFINTNNNVWTPAAGTINGRLRNVLRLAFNPTTSQQDSLYLNGVNCIIQKVGKGYIIDGQKTMIELAIGTARLNIRDLFRYVEINTASVLEDYLHSFNDAITRNQAVNAIDAILKPIQVNRGIVRYQIVCDDTNNSSADINSYQMNVWVKIEGKRPIETISVRFFDVPSGVSFEEVV
jgi:phage tail sheath protein FI